MGVILQNKVRYIFDIGSSAIRMLAVAKYAGKPRIVAEESCLYDGFIDGEFLSPEELSNIFETLFKKMLTKMRKPIHSVVVGVPSDFCVCVCKRISRKFVEPHKITTSDLEDMYESNLSFGDSENYEVINYSPMQFILDDNVKTLAPINQKTTSIVMDASYILAKTSFINLMKEKFEKNIKK